MKNRSFIIFATLSFLVFSCGNESKKEEKDLEIVEVNTKETKRYEAAPTKVSFKDPKIGAVYQNYIELKTALVNSDANTTASAATELMTAFANVGVDEDLLHTAQLISESEDVEAQRKAFVDVTMAVEKMIEGQLESGVIYKQYCPMAFDFTGGFWLSNSKEIYNPYFGDKMLRCGKIDSEIE